MIKLFKKSAPLIELYIHFIIFVEICKYYCIFVLKHTSFHCIIKIIREDDFMVARQLRVIRQQNRLTQQDIADVLGVSRSTYNGYESGKRTPDIDTIISLSAFYRMSVDELVREVDERYVYDSTYYDGQSDTTYLSKLSKTERELIVKFRQKSEDEQKKILNSIIDNE